jgi:hypothetical protein
MLQLEFHLQVFPKIFVGKCYHSFNELDDVPSNNFLLMHSFRLLVANHCYYLIFIADLVQLLELLLLGVVIRSSDVGAYEHRKENGETLDPSGAPVTSISRADFDG